MKIVLQRLCRPSVVGGKAAWDRRTYLQGNSFRRHDCLHAEIGPVDRHYLPTAGSKTMKTRRQEQPRSRRRNDNDGVFGRGSEKKPKPCGLISTLAQRPVWACRTRVTSLQGCWCPPSACCAGLNIFSETRLTRGWLTPHRRDSKPRRGTGPADNSSPTFRSAQKLRQMHESCSPAALPSHGGQQPLSQPT